MLANLKFNLRRCNNNNNRTQKFYSAVLRYFTSRAVILRKFRIKTIRIGKKKVFQNDFKITTADDTVKVQNLFHVYIN